MPFGLPTQADLFQQVGYSTWHLEKWQLGVVTRQYFPNAHSFDYSYGLTRPPLRENGKAVYKNIISSVYFPELINNPRTHPRSKLHEALLPVLCHAWYRNWFITRPVETNCIIPEGIEVSQCLPNVSNCLFDLLNDPCKMNNIAASYPTMLKLLQDKVKVYAATSIPSGIRPLDP
ncbi:hypothetical protein BV898_08578 [Hypsibius exemplaris]|uniref:Arylsulfatase B n=1 Tax=Hypsibius exemplaris TaxID=2072580 RepID=A0A1W0WQ66_HYPEX|nr:hypothetical protein BV898_08578 [Hypsibius exemplaris]